MSFLVEIKILSNIEERKSELIVREIIGSDIDRQLLKLSQITLITIPCAMIFFYNYSTNFLAYLAILKTSLIDSEKSINY